MHTDTQPHTATNGHTQSYADTHSADIHRDTQMRTKIDDAQGHAQIHKTDTSTRRYAPTRTDTHKCTQTRTHTHANTNKHTQIFTRTL